MLTVLNTISDFIECGDDSKLWTTFSPLLQAHPDLNQEFHMIIRSFKKLAHSRPFIYRDPRIRKLLRVHFGQEEGYSNYYGNSVSCCYASPQTAIGCSRLKEEQEDNTMASCSSSKGKQQQQQHSIIATKRVFEQAIKEEAEAYEATKIGKRPRNMCGK